MSSAKMVHLLHYGPPKKSPFTKTKTVEKPSSNNSSSDTKAAGDKTQYGDKCLKIHPEKKKPEVGSVGESTSNSGPRSESTSDAGFATAAVAAPTPVIKNQDPKQL